MHSTEPMATNDSSDKNEIIFEIAKEFSDTVFTSKAAAKYRVFPMATYSTLCYYY